MVGQTGISGLGKLQEELRLMENNLGAVQPLLDVSQDFVMILMIHISMREKEH